MALLLQAGVIGAVLMKNQTRSFQTASLSMNDGRAGSITRDLGRRHPPRALVRFAPDARIADITALLDNYQASVIDGAKGGMFRLQFGSKAMGKDEVAGLMSRLQKREDRQSRGGDAVSPQLPHAAPERKPRFHGPRWRELADEDAARGVGSVGRSLAVRRVRWLGGSCAKHHAHAQPQHQPAACPTINPTVAPRINPNIAGRANIAVGRPNLAVTTVARTPPPRAGVTTR